MKTALRIGLIGLGNIGYTHASTIFRGGVKGMVLGAVCDCNTDLRKELEEAFPEVPYYADYEDMLRCGNVDAVIVAVPHPLHSAIGIRAFQCGKHVLVEKPMDIRLSEAKRLCEAARKSGKQFGIMLNQRTGSLFAKTRQILQSGQLGQLKRSVWIITNWYRTQHYYRSCSWRATWLGEGGGVLVNQAPHQLDLWQWICGMPESITAFCEEGKYHAIEVEDNATVFARFPGGGEGVFITSTGEYPGTNRLEITGSKGKLVLENGLLKWWKLKQDERDFCTEAQASFAHMDMEYVELAEEVGVSGHLQILQNFADSILQGTPMIAPGYDGLNELAIQNAAYLSAWKGNVPVRLPLDEAEYDALLDEKQKASRAHDGMGGKEKKKDYHERWQINW